MNVNASVPQSARTLDLTLASLVVTTIKTADPHNASLHRALDRAVTEIRNGRDWQLNGNRLFVESRTRAGLTHVCTLDACCCETSRGVCWHRALAAIAVSAETIAAAAVACAPLVTPQPGDIAVASVEYVPSPSHRPMTDDEYAAAQAACDDLL